MFAVDTVTVDTKGVEAILKFLQEPGLSTLRKPPLGSGVLIGETSDSVTITPTVSFINGKHKLTLKPDTDQTQEARGDQFDTAIPPTDKNIPDDEILPMYEILTADAEGTISSPETDESGSTTRSPTEPHLSTKSFESITTTELPTFSTKSPSQEMTPQAISFSMHEDGSGMRTTDDEEELTTLEGSADDTLATTKDPYVVATDETEIAETEETTLAFGVDCNTKGPIVTTAESNTVEIKRTENKEIKPETQDVEGSTSTEDEGSGQAIYAAEESKHTTLSPYFTISSHSSTSSHAKEPREPVSLALPSTEPTIRVVSTFQTEAIPEESTPYITHSEKDQDTSTTKSPSLVPEIEKYISTIFTISEDISSGDQPTEAFSKQPFSTTIVPSLLIQETEEISIGAYDEATKVFEGSAEDTTPLVFTSVQTQTKSTTQSSETTILPTDSLRAVMSSSQETDLIQGSLSEETTISVQSSGTSSSQETDLIQGSLSEETTISVQSSGTSGSQETDLIQGSLSEETTTSVQTSGTSDSQETDLIQKLLPEETTTSVQSSGTSSSQETDLFQKILPEETTISVQSSGTSDSQETEIIYGSHSEETTISVQSSGTSDSQETEIIYGSHSEETTTSVQSSGNSSSQETDLIQGSLSEETTTSVQSSGTSSSQETDLFQKLLPEETTTSVQSSGTSGSQETDLFQKLLPEETTTSVQSSGTSSSQETDLIQGSLSEETTTSVQSSGTSSSQETEIIYGSHSEETTTSVQSSGTSGSQETDLFQKLLSEETTTSVQSSRTSGSQETDLFQKLLPEETTTSVQSSGTSGSQETDLFQKLLPEETTTSVQSSGTSSSQETEIIYGSHSEETTTSVQSSGTSGSQETEIIYGSLSEETTTSVQSSGTSDSHETDLFQKLLPEETTSSVKSSETSEEITQEISLSTFGFPTEKPLTSFNQVSSSPTTSVATTLNMKEPVRVLDRATTSATEDVFTTPKATSTVAFVENVVDYEDVASPSIVEGQPPSREEFTTRKPVVWTDSSYTVESHIEDLQGTVPHNIFVTHIDYCLICAVLY